MPLRFLADLARLLELPLLECGALSLVLPLRLLPPVACIGEATVATRDHAGSSAAHQRARRRRVRTQSAQSDRSMAAIASSCDVHRKAAALLGSSASDVWIVMLVPCPHHSEISLDAPVARRKLKSERRFRILRPPRHAGPQQSSSFAQSTSAVLACA